MKYRKKPVVIDAVQWATDNFTEVDDFAGSQMRAHENGSDLVIKTLEGDMVARPFDFIIRGVKGEFYPCKPDIFKATYDNVEE